MLAWHSSSLCDQEWQIEKAMEEKQEKIRPVDSGVFFLLFFFYFNYCYFFSTRSLGLNSFSPSYQGIEEESMGMKEQEEGMVSKRESDARPTLSAPAGGGLWAHSQ